MHIIADANMPGLEPFEDFATVERVDGRTLTREQLGEAEILLVRSVTRVDASLLAGSRVRFIGSATIGTDHVDLAYLAQVGIEFAHAPGCNARAVAEYVLQAVLLLCAAQGRSPQKTRVAVVGLGNVGRRVADWLGALGMTVQGCDPLLERAGYAGPVPLAPLDQLLQADIITLHVPLTQTGDDSTRHLLDADRLSRLGSEQMLINTCRGPVIDNAALSQQLTNDTGPLTVLDVWETEPTVPPTLYQQVLMGSPHIAGYSLEGKLKGTRMLYDAVCEWSGREAVTESGGADASVLRQPVTSNEDLLALLQKAYRLKDDYRRLGDSLHEAAPDAAFDRLRKQYPVRHELHHWQHDGPVADAWTAVVSRLFEPDGVAR
jgi:erythronate-4-phosphate dehydrogenase